MARPDLLLLHPPTTWDFRERPRLAGPVADLVPSSPVFEMYPVGFVTMADYLCRNGLEVRIANLAVRMLDSSRFDPERFIKRQRPKAFGIGLHWLPHAHGAIEAAKAVKKHHPDTPVIFGGLSSTYYHKELIRKFPTIDYVLRGDSTERPLLRLLRTLDRGGDLSQVPNLTWRDGAGRLKVNKEMDIPKDLDHLSFDYDIIIRSIIKYKDMIGYMPTLDWRRYPVTAQTLVRGCTQDCIVCGGSCTTYRRMNGRARPAFRSPSKVVSDMAHISSILDGPIFLVCDLRQAGMSYALKILNGLRKERIGNQVVLELFWPAPRDFLEEIARALDRFNISLSPDSHDPEVRGALGRHYDNRSMERCIKDSFDLGCNRFDLYFMIGLPRQERDGPLGSVEYSRRLMMEHRRHELHCYISPLAPFLDPGSIAFEDPKAHGYVLKARTLKQHIRLLTMPSWKHSLNYETDRLSAEDIVSTTYGAAAALNEAKLEAGHVDQQEHDDIKVAIEASLEAMKRIDRIMRMGRRKDREQKLKELKDLLDRTGRDLLVGTGEMEWPTKGIKYSGILKKMLFKKG